MSGRGDWQAGLKVGDPIAVRYGFSGENVAFGKVVRLSGKVRRYVHVECEVGDYTFKESGSVRGASAWDATLLVEPTASLRASVKEAKLSREQRAYLDEVRWSDVSSETRGKVIALLQAERAAQAGKS